MSQTSKGPITYIVTQQKIIAVAHLGGNHHNKENTNEGQIGPNKGKQKEIQKFKNNNTTTKSLEKT
jgi:hypothetical protein